MFLVDDILLFPVHSILWIFREIHQAAESEIAGEEEEITESLRLLYMQLETGQITEQQFDAEEKLLLDRLEVIEERRGHAEEVEEAENSTPDRDSTIN